MIMKIMLIYIFFLVCSFCEGQTIADSNIVTLNWSEIYNPKQLKQKGAIPFSGLDTIIGYFSGERYVVVQKFYLGVKEEVKIYYENGKIKEYDQFCDGKLTGISQEWYKNGQKKHDAVLLNGNKVGVALGFFENGAVKYFSDSKNISISFYQNGKIESRTIYLDSSKCGNFLGLEETRWQENGQLLLKQVNNCGEATYSQYYNDSTLSLQFNMINMPLFIVGDYKEWYPNGKLAVRGQYEDNNNQKEANIKTGIWKYYDENGNLLKEEEYKKNVLIKSKEFKKNFPIKN